MADERELEDMKKLTWKLFSIGSAMLGVTISVIIVLFVYGNNVNAQQWQKLNKKLDQKSFVEYKKENKAEHTEIKKENKEANKELKKSIESVKKEVSEVKSEVGVMGVKIDNISEDMKEIKELLKK